MSNDWKHKHKHDFYYRQAKQKGYVSRAAFKLLQINKKFKIIKKGDIVIDFCCAPGGWLQVAKSIVGPTGLVIGVDISKIRNITGVVFIKADIYDPELPMRIHSILEKKLVDVVMSDCAPKLTGQKSLDAYRQADLVMQCLTLAKQLLAPKGHFIAKVFQSSELNKLLLHIKAAFEDVRLFKPKASKKESPEMYVIARYFKQKQDI